MNKELENIALYRKVPIEIQTSSWNRGAARFPVVTKVITYNINNWIFEIKYELKIADFTTPNAFTNISNIHYVEIHIYSENLKITNFQILYRNKLQRFFFRKKFLYRVLCKNDLIKKVFEEDDDLYSFYQFVDINEFGFNPYFQGKKSDKYFKCELSFYLSTDPKIEFLNSLELLTKLTFKLDKIGRISD